MMFIQPFACWQRICLTDPVRKTLSSIGERVARSRIGRTQLIVAPPEISITPEIRVEE